MSRFFFFLFSIILIEYYKKYHNDFSHIYSFSYLTIAPSVKNKKTDMYSVYM